MQTDLFVSRRGGQIWTALREDGETVELRVESAVAGPAVGRIVRARVTRVLPGIQSAFLDLGGERDGFLHVTDLWLPGDPAPASRGQDGGLDSVDGATDLAARARAAAPIEDRLSVGRELIVQVARGSLGAKGARVTCYLTLPGRLLVLFPQLTLRSVSRRIVDPDERERLLELVGTLPGQAGFVARTAAAGAGAADLAADAERLLAKWRDLEAKIAAGGPTGMLHGDVDLALRALRDAPPEGYRRVVFDDRELFQRATEWARGAAPRWGSALELHQGPGELFESEGLDTELERALRRQVWLKSGGTIVIERTEALVSIDVNTGKFLGRRKLEETARKTNLEAAREIARQLRLRDLGGIIVIDFIDMQREESRVEVMEALAEALTRDRARTQVHPFSPLGLVQLTRKRTRQAPEDLLTARCSTCRGGGRLKRPETVASLARGELARLAAAAPAARFVLSAGRAVLEAFAEVPGATAVELREDPALPRDGYEIRLIPPADGEPTG